MQKKTILFVGSFRSTGADGSVGGQMYACRSLISSSLGDKYNWLQVDSTADTNIPEAFGVRLARALKRLMRFLKLVATTQVDCCIIFTADGWSFVEKGTMAIVGKLAGKKIVLAPRSGLVTNDVERSWILKRYIISSIRASDYVVCQGEKWKQFYLTLSAEPESKFRVIENWIAVDQYQIAEQSGHNNAPRILYMSWVDKNKGIFDLVSAAERLVRAHPHLLFIVAGSGAAMQELGKNIVARNLEKNFDLVGWVQGAQKHKLLQTSNIFVLPSYFEGYPNSLMEAMVSGLPVVATKVGAIPEIIQHGKNGLLFNAGDISMLESELESLISDRDFRVHLGKSARATIMRSNSLDLAVEKFVNIIEE